MNSIALDSEYVPQNRPYSQNELHDKRDFLHKKLRLSSTMANHENCGHFYLTKRNSKKEKDILENNCSDQGNCSVCWRLKKTSYLQKKNAEDLVHSYCNKFRNRPDGEFLNYNDVDIENVFYSWLYEDVAPKQYDKINKDNLEL